MQYCISIGDVVMCKWSGDEENWESKSNNGSEYPYAETSVTMNSSLIDSQRSRKSIKKDATPAFPDVVTKRLCIPFEFRFTNQEVSWSKRLLNLWRLFTWTLVLGLTWDQGHIWQLPTLRGLNPFWAASFRASITVRTVDHSRLIVS